MLLMPSKATQAFLKWTIEENPQITNNELVSEVEKASKVYARYYVNGNVQDPAPDGQPWSLEAALGCFESFYVLEALPRGGAHVTCSSATVRSVSGRRHACIAYWPVWRVMQPSECLQLVWE